MEERLNIYQKLAKIRKPVEVLRKNKKGYDYEYVTEDLILSKITGLMTKFGVSLIPSVNNNSIEVTPYNYVTTKTTRDGNTFDKQNNEIIVCCDMTWTWVNNDNPDERVVVPWALVGQQSQASQAFGSGLTYASRYFMLKYFNVATPDDDPDNWKAAQKAAEGEFDKEIAGQIVEKIHLMVVGFLEKNPDRKDDVANTVRKYARSKSGKASANYYDIEDPAVASELLNEFKEKYLINNKEE